GPVVRTRGYPQLCDSGLSTGGQVASNDDNVIGNNGRVGDGIAIEQVNERIGAATDQSRANWVGNVVHESTCDHGHGRRRSARARDRRRNAVLRWDRRRDRTCLRGLGAGETWALGATLGPQAMNTSPANESAVPRLQPMLLR